MSYIRAFLSTLPLTSLVLGCPSEPPMMRPDQGQMSRDAAFCEAIPTQKECFEGGCSFFTNASALVTQDGTCTTSTAVGLCLWSPEPDGEPRLTTYQRTLEGGRVEALRLNFDVELEGWRRCGSLEITRDCDCDGVPDP